MVLQNKSDDDSEYKWLKTHEVFKKDFVTNAHNSKILKKNNNKTHSDDGNK